MEKKLIQADIPFKFDWTYGVTLDYLKDDLAQLEKLGATHIHIESEGGYEGCHTVSISAYQERLETDEEYQARINKKKQEEERYRNQELREYERLKRKFEKQ